VVKVELISVSTLLITRKQVQLVPPSSAQPLTITHCTSSRCRLELSDDRATIFLIRGVRDVDRP
jgi:hypothetical protein